MINSFDGGIIDVSSVVLIIKKLELYIENEEKIILDIKNTLLILENYYISDNDKVLKVKKKKLYNVSDTILENKKRYIEYLNYVVNNYIELDEKNMFNFNYNIN